MGFPSAVRCATAHLPSSSLTLWDRFDFLLECSVPTASSAWGIAYLWTQCIWNRPERNSLMLAAAVVPLPVGGFTGCICSVFYHSREYRLATYRGTRIEAWSASGAVVRQGKYRLEAELLHECRQALRAPVEGRMERTVHESLCAEVRYRFWRGKDLLFQHTDQNASFEYSSTTGKLPFAGSADKNSGNA